MRRRDFLAGTACALPPLTAAGAVPIIDTHIHLFDPRRKEGVPWPDPKNTALYQPALPARYRALAAPLGVVGAIEVECSPWVEDNQWVLDTAAQDGIIAGMVGNLEPGKPEFPKLLERFRRNPLFLGIRYGYLWGRNLRAELGKPEFLAGLKLLADAGLVLDTANPSPALLEDVLRLNDRAPGLRVVIDHLPRIEAQPSEYGKSLRELGQRPNVYVKFSGLLRRVDGRVPEDLDFYRPRFEELWGVFGEDRLIYGSDWPNSDNWAPFDKALRLARAYLAEKGRAAEEKVFWRNSAAVYRWKRREKQQPETKAARA